ncbi:SGNH/GDSL hydrolase family protein [Acetobacter sp. A11-2]|uniref:SGNH/GDSL hydrolase family protein n=1 Tax=Acetobacter sp. A11-2 TaxID=3157859 RepID=UPI0032EF0DEE
MFSKKESGEDITVKDNYSMLRERIYDFLTVQDFGFTGISVENDRQVLEKADSIFQKYNRKTLRVSAGSELIDDGEFALSRANHIILIGDGKIRNAFRRAVHPDHLSGPEMFPSTIKPFHLRCFHKACRKGEATVVVVGDSIFAVASDMVAPTENAAYAWIETLQQQNPGVKLRFVNAALGARNWNDMASNTTNPPPWINPKKGVSWKQAIRDLEPDLVLINSTGNDVGNFQPNAVYDFISYLKNSSKEPSIILGISHLPSLASDVNNYTTMSYLDGLDSVARWLRSYAQYYGLGYLDFYRWQSIRRDGFDPCEVVLTKMDIQGKEKLPKILLFKNNYIYSKFYFPIISLENGLSTNKCTDFSVSFECKNKVSFISIDLSKEQDRLDHVNRLAICLNNEDGKISYCWSDGSGVLLEPIKTNIDIPTFPARFNILLKGSRVVYSVWQAFKDTDWDPQDLSGMGVGYTDICDQTVIRFGGVFHPSIQTEGETEIILYNLCIANACIVEGGGRRNRPDRTDAELYEVSQAAGGSGHYHMNAYGVRDILVPVIRNQMWYDEGK